MTTILCYGDSLTWGYDPDTAGRHAFGDRWASVLDRGLREAGIGGDDLHVIAEGLNGRTTAFDDHTLPGDRNGVRVLPTLLATHQPLDLLIVMLGTNDLKRHTGGGRVFEARAGMERIVEITRGFPYLRGYAVPEILIVAPPAFRETTEPDFALLFGGSVDESIHFRSAYTKVADEYDCFVFDASEVCETSTRDGVHLDAAHTRALGTALVEPVRAILSGEAQRVSHRHRGVS